MSALGVHFAITESEASKFRSLPGDKSRLRYIQEVIETNYFQLHAELMAESDKAWDAMHRTLTDGQLSWEGGIYPFNHTVLGGEKLYTGSDYIISLKTQSQVVDIAAALPTITETDFRKRYFAIDARNYRFPLSEDDFQYTWDWFQCVRDLYILAAKERRFVLFTVDQ